MATLKEEALKYEPKQSKNIADLNSVSVLLPLYKETRQPKDGKPYVIQFVTMNGDEYRVPDSVLKDLKTHLEEKPNLLYFKVKKTGTGLTTEYTVIPLEDVNNH